MRRGLRALNGNTADIVARHLVAAGVYVDEDPALALAHAKAARALAGRLGVVREAVGIAAYHAGAYAEALAELRAARRLTGSDEHLPVMADAERGLGRPERALALVLESTDAQLDGAARAELMIVGSGARRDLGEPRAAALALKAAGAEDQDVKPWSARLRYAYAAALLDAGDRSSAKQWFEAALAVDADDDTDAADQLNSLS